MDPLASRLERIGLDAGLDAVGVASAEPFHETRRTIEERRRLGLDGGMQFTYRDPGRSTDPERALAGARSLVVGARSYRRVPRDAERTAPHSRAAVARYSWVDHYEPLRRALDAVALELKSRGWRALVLADDNALVDREAAFRAGLGFYGKNTNLLLHGRGSEFVLGAVVTDAPLTPAEAAIGDSRQPQRHDGCGPCSRCLPACPTGALVAPGVLDASRCLAWLLQAEGLFPARYREALGGRIYGCDDCQDACPPNRIEIRRSPPPPAEAGAEPTVDLVELLATEDDDDLLRRYGRWYIPKRQAGYLRRNALVALGNVGDGDDDETRRALGTHLAHADANVRAHAVWAAARLGCRDLIDDIVPTDDVLAELGALPAAR